MLPLALVWAAAALPQDASWPRPAFLDLELDLSAPPRFVERARVTYAKVTTRRLRFLLNDALAVESARSGDGAELECKPLLSLGRERYHGEGRTWRVDLGREPEPGGEPLTLDLAIAGVGEDGSQERDWRGILLLAPDELRMSEQTVFYPQVPLSLDGPGKAASPARVEVLAPAELELFVAGAPIEPRAEGREGVRAWAFDVADPGTLDVVAGRYVRSERELDGLRLVALLFPEHAYQADAWLDEAARAVRHHGELFGAHRAEVLAVAEMRCRKGSYNWASRGLLMFDHKVFGSAVPVEKIGHEVAHLWWGQTVHAEGPGERFLTEGLAEYSAWRYVEAVSGAAAAGALASEAREAYLRAVHESGQDPALARVDFATPGYSALAYGKGALVLRGLEQRLGRAPLDAGLARYAARHAGATAGLDDLSAALFEGAPEGWASAPWIRADGHAHVERASERDASGTLAWRLADCPAGIPICAPSAIPWRARPSGASGEARVVDGGFEVPSPEGPVAVTLDPDVGLPLAGELSWARGGASLVRSDPADGDEGVGYLRGAIVLEFDRPLARLDRGGQRALTARIREAGASDPERSAPWIELPMVSGSTLTLLLKGPLEPEEPYLLAVDGLLDAEGVPVAPAAVRFTTAAPEEREPPTVVSTEPASGARDVPRDLSEIRIRFSEPMRAGRGYSSALVTELEASGLRFPGALLGASRWAEKGTVLVYDLKGELEAGVTYIMPLRGAFRDLHGNPLEDFDLTFGARE